MRRVAAELVRDRPPQGTPTSWVEQATVAAVTPGGASDGNAAVTVTWRGSAMPATYLAAYTPTVGHVVAVVVQPPNTLLIVGRVIGTP